MQMLPPGATLQDATEWLRSCGVIADAVQAEFNQRLKRTGRAPGSWRH